MYAMPESEQAISVDLSHGQTLEITRPSSEEFTTYYSKYFIMGTSDPLSLPLTLNWRRCRSPWRRRYFGVLVELSLGENSFTFEQGKMCPVLFTIIREEEGSWRSLPTISSILKLSFP